MNYFYVEMTATKAAKLLSDTVSPCLFYHHNRQGCNDWVVEQTSTFQTRIGLASTVDESVITFLLLKA